MQVELLCNIVRSHLLLYNIIFVNGNGIKILYMCVYLYIFEGEEGYTTGININYYRVRLVERKI